MFDAAPVRRPPSVSVIMPAFNVGGFIDRAIASVVSQSFPDWELIAVDDHSSDATAAIVTDWTKRDPRIRLLRTNTNVGAGGARNIALAAASASWVAPIDADDAWRPDRLVSMLPLAQKLDVEFLADNQIFYDDALGHEVGQATSFPHWLSRLTLTDLFNSERDGRFPLSLLKPLMSREFLLKTGLRYRYQLRFAEDLDLYAQILMRGGRAAVLSTPHYIYTNPVGPISRIKSRASRTNNSAGIKVEIADRLLTDFSALMSPAERLAISAYRVRAQAKHHAQCLTSFRMERAWAAAARLALTHPTSTLGYAMRSPMLRRLNARQGSPSSLRTVEPTQLRSFHADG